MLLPSLLSAVIRAAAAKVGKVPHCVRSPVPEPRSRSERQKRRAAPQHETSARCAKRPSLQRALLRVPATGVERSINWGRRRLLDVCFREAAPEFRACSGVRAAPGTNVAKGLFPAYPEAPEIRSGSPLRWSGRQIAAKRQRAQPVNAVFMRPRVQRRYLCTHSSSRVAVQWDFLPFTNCAARSIAHIHNSFTGLKSSPIRLSSVTEWC